MSTFLYRAVALEAREDEWTGEPIYFVGDSLGRATGYLSRSAAKDAGERSGVEYTIVKSLPVLFVLPKVVEQAQRIQELEETLATVTPIGRASA